MAKNKSIMVTFLMLTLIVGVLPGAFLWPYSINTWLVFLGKTPVVIWWHGLILGIIPGIGHATIPFADITWILMLFLV